MYYYKLYGLYISSTIEFKFFSRLSTKKKPDIIVSESFDSHNYVNSNCNDFINISKAVIYRSNIGHFEINNGKEIKFYRENKYTKDEDIVRSLINAVIGYCLYQRGGFVIHASSIEIDGHSFIFFGRSGSGKSSLSGDLCINHGANFICEDVAYIKDEDNFSIGVQLYKADEISGLQIDSAKK